MSLRRNILANYVGQIYVTLIGIVLVPLYVKYMGAEAYGLVGFFAMLQAWFGLLDLGLTPTIGRETARFHGGAMSALSYRQLFRSLSVIFVGIAILGGGGLLLLADVVATRWLNVKALAPGEAVLAVQIMAISVALRWMGGLYRGVITGSERLVWMSGFTALIATLRFVTVFGSMWQFGYTPKVFFVHQFVVALVEVAGLFVMSRGLLPHLGTLEIDSVGWSLKPVQPVLKFSLSMAFTSSVWVLVTQTDKLVLSGILPLAEYGYFTLAVLVANGIVIISAPISSAIMPRMARLHAEGKNDELIQLYRNSTKMVSAIAGAAAISIAFCAEHLLYAWSGNAELAKHAAPILRLYAAGNGVLAVAAFPYYLQYAKGSLRYHLIGNAILVVFLIPGIVLATTKFGGVGAGYVWLSMNLLYLLAWIGYVHKKIEPGLHLVWMREDIVFIILPALIFLYVLSLISVDVSGRFGSAIYTTLSIGMAVVLTTFRMPRVREKTLKMFLKLYGQKS